MTRSDAFTWGRGRTPPVRYTSPFHRFGVRIKKKADPKRDRRLSSEEERPLLAAADAMNTAEHLYAGAQMRDRIIGALETVCRLGEMLKIQNRHVLWDTYQISIPAEHAKDAESKRIPFEPNGRLAKVMERRRFLGLPRTCLVITWADVRPASERRGRRSCSSRMA
jgi:integrase